MQQGVAEKHLDPTIWKAIVGACMQEPSLDSKVISPTCIEYFPLKKRNRFRQIPT